MNGTARRPLWARIGLTLLNFWAAGLGILRTGPLRTALLFLFLMPVVAALAWVWFRMNNPPGFYQWAFAVTVILLAQVGAWIGALVVTWRRSRDRGTDVPVWSRWYALLAAAIVVPLVMMVLAGALRGEVRNFYIPSEAMMPTFVKNDRLVASMRLQEPLRRGDIILFRMPGEVIYIKRLAALPGDRIALQGGVVILNGRAVPQRLLREETAPGDWQKVPVRRLAERFPGEAGEHEIYDSGPSDVDDMPERLIPPGHLFVLGDYRDRSADSRVPREAMGVELLPAADVAGRPLFHSWGSSRPLGQPVAR